MINGSDKCIKFNEMKNKIFLDALSKSDARWDGKQEFFFIWPKVECIGYSKESVDKEKSGNKWFQIEWGDLRPHKKILFPVLARITFGERIKKNFIFHFIEFCPLSW